MTLFSHRPGYGTSSLVLSKHQEFQVSDIELTEKRMTRYHRCGAREK